MESKSPTTEPAMYPLHPQLFSHHNQLSNHPSQPLLQRPYPSHKQPRSLTSKTGKSDPPPTAPLNVLAYLISTLLSFNVCSYVAADHLFAILASRKEIHAHAKQSSHSNGCGMSQAPNASALSVFPHQLSSAHPQATNPSQFCVKETSSTLKIKMVKKLLFPLPSSIQPAYPQPTSCLKSHWPTAEQSRPRPVTQPTTKAKLSEI